jgi:hypothetical protein
MKARDLAALAALGIAGKYAFDKFGNKKKDDEPKSKGKLGEAQSANDSDEGEREARMSKRDTNEGSGRRDAGGNTEDVDRRAGVAERMGRDAAGSRFTDRDVATAPVAVAKPVRTPVVTRSVAAAPAAAASPAADAVADDYVMPRTAPKPVMPDASRVTQYNSDIMYAPTVKSDPNVEHDAEMNRLARTRATRQGTVVAQTPNAQAQARILRQGPTPAQSATNAQAQARLLRQGAPSTQVAAPQQSRYTKDRYGNIIDNTTGKVSRTIYSAGQEGNAARVGMKRGGVVKMASGGMASSKMSKPSGASRGDGIAQRGKTRGTLR